jgi:hypothetical protein
MRVRGALAHSLLKISNEVAPPFPRFVREEPALSEVEGWASTKAAIISARSRLRAVREHSISTRPSTPVATEGCFDCTGVSFCCTPATLEIAASTAAS